MGGYAAPKAPAGQSCSDDVFPVTTDDWVSHRPDTRPHMIVTEEEFRVAEPPDMPIYEKRPLK